MALRSRIKRLEESARKRGTWQAVKFDYLSWEPVWKHPDGPALIAEASALIERLIAGGCSDEIELRQAIMCDKRGQELALLISEIQLDGLTACKG